MKYLRCILVIAALIANAALLSAKTYVIYDGGSLSWNNSTGDACDCPFSGNNCRIKNSVHISNVVDGGNVWHVTGRLEYLQADITLSDGKPYSQALGIAGYTFPTGWFEVLQGEFRGVPPTRINLQGVVTRPDGSFEATVQKAS